MSNKRQRNQRRQYAREVTALAGPRFPMIVGDGDVYLQDRVTGRWEHLGQTTGLVIQMGKAAIGIGARTV